MAHYASELSDSLRDSHWTRWPNVWWTASWFVANPGHYLLNRFMSQLTVELWLKIGMRVSIPSHLPSTRKAQKMRNCGISGDCVGLGISRQTIQRPFLWSILRCSKDMRRQLPVLRRPCAEPRMIEAVRWGNLGCRRRKLRHSGQNIR